MSDKELRASRWRDYSVVMQSAMNALNPVMTIGAQFKDAIQAHAEVVHGRRSGERSAEVLRLVGIDPVHLQELSAPADRRHAAAGHDRDGAGVHART